VEPLELSGYERPDGSTGFRNHLLVLPSVVCSAEAANRIAAALGAATFYNPYGCAQLGADREITERTLTGMALNPNVGAVIVVGLGCETVRPEKIADRVAASGKPVELVVIQEVGGFEKAVERGVEVGRRLLSELSKQSRRSTDFSSLTLGVKCGGSDATSGIVANPVVGMVADMVVDLGGRVVFGETPEAIGAEHILASRASSREVAEKILAAVKAWEERALALGVDLRGAQPTPGNIEGGITTIEEKSLGAIRKSGSRPIRGFLEYAERVPKESGVYMMDTPGFDVETVTGLAAGGAQAVIFTTGRGSPLGSPIAPVIKVTANPRTASVLRDMIDFDASGAITEGTPLESLARELFKLLVEVLNGRKTVSEARWHREFGIFKPSPSF